MPVMTSSQAKRLAEEILLDRMKIDGPERKFAKLEWYENEKFRKGQMTEEERIVYFIVNAYQDAVEAGANYPVGHLAKIVNKAITMHRMNQSIEAITKMIVELLGGPLVTVYNTTKKIIEIWDKK